MVADELATYLAAAGLGLTVGANLFKVPFPESSPDAAVCLVEYGAEQSAGTFGASLSPPAIERPSVKVMVRAGRDQASTARATADAVYKKLRRLTNTALSGALYYSIDAEPPQWLSVDENNRPRYHFDLRIEKAEA